MSAVLERQGANERPSAPRPHRFTVDEYYRMGAAGIFSEDARVELIEGEIVEMVPIGSPHADWVDRLTRLFVLGTPDEVTVRVQNPVRLSNHSEPEPDFALLKHRDLPYSQSHPGPEDVLLLVEVSDSTLKYDREVKLPLYARHGVPEVWILDIGAGRLHVYREPTPEGYRLHLRPSPDETVSPEALPGLVLRLGRLIEARGE